MHVPVFVQPDSEQACLLGINATCMSALGFKVLSGNESVVMPNVCPTSAPVLAMVSLVHSVAVPSYYSCIVRTKLSSPISTSDNLLFEPEPEALVLLGLNACESVVAASEDNEVLLVVQNYQGITVDASAWFKRPSRNPSYKHTQNDRYTDTQTDYRMPLAHAH